MAGKRKDYTDGVTDVMGHKHPPRAFRVGQWVLTKSGLKGKVIGSALYVTGYEYRIKVPGKKNTMYREESELRTPSIKLGAYLKRRGRRSKK